jgi:glycosyltransferase involved in cell wall biosynthesis
MVARLSIEKNISIALSALARAIKTYSHMGLVVVGDGPLLLSLQHEAARLGITDHVVFDGWITNASSLFSYYKTADVFLLTSRHEAFSQALIEAAAAKLPIISTDVGIASEIFTDRTSILLVPQNNDMAIASALTLLLNNNQKRKQLGLDAHEEVMAIFGSEEEYLARLQQSITQCFSESQPHHA